MNTIIKQIIELLDDDMVSHGLLLQYMKNAVSENGPLQIDLEKTLRCLLNTGIVAIGTAILSTPNYVEFIAWRGSIEQRIQRAIATVAALSPTDSEFAYWLCKIDNVDRYEEL